MLLTSWVINTKTSTDSLFKARKAFSIMFLKILPDSAIAQYQSHFYIFRYLLQQDHYLSSLLLLQ